MSGAARGRGVVLAALLAVALPSVAQAAPSAFVANAGGASATRVDLTRETASAAVGTPGQPAAVAISPGAGTAYVAASVPPSVTPVDVASGAPGTPILMSGTPKAIAIDPGGTLGLVATGAAVVPFDVRSNAAGPPIAIPGASAVAFTPDGRTAFVASADTDTVVPVDVASRATGAPIGLGAGTRPVALTVTPDGRTVYVAGAGAGAVQPIDVASRRAGGPILVTGAPTGLAMAPDGQTAYASSRAADAVTPIDVATNSARPAIAVGGGPSGLAVSPSGATLYAALADAGALAPIDLASRAARAPVPTGPGATAVAVTPDQAPEAVFRFAGSGAGTGSLLDARESSSPAGRIASYTWDFGDGRTQTTTNPLIGHVYPTAATYRPRLTVTNSAGTSVAQVFTGQTVSRQGAPRATLRGPVVVPGRDATGSSATNQFRFPAVHHRPGGVLEVNFLAYDRARLRLRTSILDVKGRSLGAYAATKVRRLRGTKNVTTVLRPGRKGRSRLRHQRRLHRRTRVMLTVTLTPTGGAPATKSRPITLRTDRQGKTP